MLFKQEHIDKILRGEKTQTRRLWKRPMAKVGGTYWIQVNYYRPRKDLRKIRVLGLRQERLGDITDADAKLEGGYTREQFIQKWVDINGTWDPNENVYVVTFEYGA